MYDFQRIPKEYQKESISKDTYLGYHISIHHDSHPYYIIISPCYYIDIIIISIFISVLHLFYIENCASQSTVEYEQQCIFSPSSFLWFAWWPVSIIWYIDDISPYLVTLISISNISYSFLHVLIANNFLQIQFSHPNYKCWPWWWQNINIERVIITCRNNYGQTWKLCSHLCYR